MTETPSDIPTTRKPRWYAPTPAKFLFAVLVMQGVLFLSAHYRWFWFNERKGYTVLIAVAATILAMLSLAAFALASWLFKSRLQFSLATLLLIVPVIGIPFAWLTRERELARRQSELVDFAKRVKLDSPVISNDVLTVGLGKHFFHDVIEIDLAPRTQSRVPVTDADVARYRHLPRLNRFVLFGTGITDASMEHLKDLAELTDLDLSYTKVSGKGIDQLAVLPKLERLNLHQTQVDDAGLAKIAELPHLRWLELTGTYVTDAGLEHIKKLTTLERITLVGNRISDTGIEHLRDLRELQSVVLFSTAVTDAGVVHLRGLTNLKSLVLKHTAITDAAIESLEGLTNLRELNVSETRVTLAGLQRLETALPSCRIQHMGRWNK